MKRVLVFIAGLLVVGVALAQTGSALLTWVPSSTYTNGAPMQTGEQRLYVERTNETQCGAGPATWPNQLATLTAGIASYQHSSLWNGAYYYIATVVDIFGTESAASNMACKVVNISGNWEPPPQGVIPNPPTNLVAQ